MSTVVCIMGPTASGKTDLALSLANKWPIEIISVDSGQIYHDMDIGTAKPDTETLKQIPHHLINIVAPTERYSAAQFAQEANAAIEDIHARKKIPILAGGTMLYFKALQQGLSKLPTTDPEVCNQIANEIAQKGTQAVYEQLRKIDPQAASGIHSNDTQRIQRALAVYRSTGKTLSDWWQTSPPEHKSHIYHWRNVVIGMDDRPSLHQRIETRFKKMIEQGFIEEVESLQQKYDLSEDLPAMRSVGYRQVWQYLAKNFDKNTLIEKGVAATRQLAKRQITWLRSWKNLEPIEGNIDNWIKNYHP